MKRQIDWLNVSLTLMVCLLLSLIGTAIYRGYKVNNATTPDSRLKLIEPWNGNYSLWMDTATSNMIVKFSNAAVVLPKE